MVLLCSSIAAGCVGELAPGSEEKEADYSREIDSVVEPLTTTERRFMLFEGSCHFLACCSKRNCSLPDRSVVGACGTGCSDSTPWIARPNRDRRYACGECVRVCREGTTSCVDAAVWDNSITSSRIEGNVALFDRLGLAHTDNPSACTGSGGAWVTVGPCTGPPPGDGGEPTPEDPAPEDPPEEPTPPSDPVEPPPPDDAGCVCTDTCGYCWCGTSRENACPESYRGTGDGCDCGCQWKDPDCGIEPDPGGGDPGGSEPPPPTSGGSFAGVYCTNPGWGCGGNSPCWPASDCPSGSSCDWASGSWGRCMR
jgi:hypothetical protein